RASRQGRQAYLRRPGHRIRPTEPDHGVLRPNPNQVIRQLHELLFCGAEGCHESTGDERLEKTEDAGYSRGISVMGGIAVAEGKVTRGKAFVVWPTNRWTGARIASFST